MLTSDHKYRLASFGEDDLPATLYGQAERVYLESIGSTARTSTNEIAYWKDRYNRQFAAQGDKLFVFGLLESDEVIGFALVFYFDYHRLMVVDHIAIKEPARNFGSFFAFKNMIVEYFLNKNLQIDYVIAEIVTSKSGDPHPVDPQLLIQLLKQQGFKVAHLPYFTPSIKEDEYTSRIDAALMIYRNERSSKIGSAKLLSLIDCILFDLYVRWYTPHSRNIHAFRKQIRVLKKLYKDEVRGKDIVELNGNWIERHAQVALSADSNATNESSGKIVTAVVLLVFLGVISALLATVSYYSGIGASGVILIFVSALFAFLTILAIWHKTASTQADKVLSLIVTLVRGHEKVR